MEKNELSSPLISVIVCTYNRSDLILGVLQSLCDQSIDKSYYEVIIVDNNSTDNTRNLSERFCHRHQNMYYLVETTQGLSYARNRGWKEAKGEYIAYIDDDCQAPEQWLAVAKEIMAHLSPGVLGGPSYAFYNTTKPNWYLDAYGSNVPFHNEKPLNNKECVNIFGCNMFFRRSLIENHGGFDVELGMRGDKIGYCEETALILDISNSIKKELIYYDPKLYVYHLVQKERMSVRWLIHSWFMTGLYSTFISDNNLTGEKIQSRKTLKDCGKISLQLAIIVRDIVHGAFRRNRIEQAYFQNYLYESTYRHFYVLGKLCGPIYRRLKHK